MDNLSLKCQTTRISYIEQHPNVYLFFEGSVMPEQSLHHDQFPSSKIKNSTDLRELQSQCAEMLQGSISVVLWSR